MTVLTGLYYYPERNNITITRDEYDVLRELFRRISAERLAADACGPAEVLDAIQRTDAVLSRLQALYAGPPNVCLN